jgi:hypothetical protein
MIVLDAAMARSAGAEDRSPRHYGPELAKEAERRPTGGSLRRAPGGSSPLFWLDQSLISFYELPPAFFAIMLTVEGQHACKFIDDWWGGRAPPDYQATS